MKSDPARAGWPGRCYPPHSPDRRRDGELATSAAYARHGALGARELLVDGGARAREVELVEGHRGAAELLLGLVGRLAPRRHHLVEAAVRRRLELIPHERVEAALGPVAAHR